MITVRFPTGFSIQYNDANYVHRSSEYTDLYTEKDGNWIAQAPNSALIERFPPCRTYNPISTATERVQAEITALRKEVRSLTRKVKKA